MAHNQNECKHLTIAIYRNFGNGKVKNANCINCLININIKFDGISINDLSATITKEDNNE